MGACRPDSGFVVNSSLFNQCILLLSASCDKCNHDRAYFYQLQIRSADEPMTTCDYPSFAYGLQKLMFKQSIGMLQSWTCDPLFNVLVHDQDALIAPTSGVKTEHWWVPLGFGTRTLSVSLDL